LLIDQENHLDNADDVVDDDDGDEDDDDDDDDELTDRRRCETSDDDTPLTTAFVQLFIDILLCPTILRMTIFFLRWYLFFRSLEITMFIKSDLRK